MVLVELYDSEPIENLVGFIVTKPRKVVFLGEKKKTERFEKIFSGVAKNRNIKTTFESRPVNRNFLQGMVDVLEDLVRSVNEENPKEEIVFDLCGGDDLMLVAAGIVYKAHSEIIQLQRYNVYTNKLIDCDENIISESQSKAEENQDGKLHPNLKKMLLKCGLFAHKITGNGIKIQVSLRKRHQTGILRL